MTGEKASDGAVWSIRGRGAWSRFEGREAAISLDGEVTTGMLGLDRRRGPWQTGLALSHSAGAGGYGWTGGRRDDAKAHLTTLAPWAAYRATDGITVWGALGHGRGALTLAPRGRRALTTDISMTMAAAGGRGTLIGPPREGGFGLAAKTDALWLRAPWDGSGRLAAGLAGVSRLRLGLEGSWRAAAGADALEARLETGLRQDGGDAETGFGVELGGGLAWTDPSLDLSLDLSGRTLIAHEDDDLKDRGFAASMAWDPNPASERGPSLSLRQDWGGQAQGGLDALFRDDPLEDRSGGGEDTVRWRAEAAYGFPALGGRFTGSPNAGFGLAMGARDYSLGWRLTPESRTAPDRSLGLKATRRESDTAKAEHTLGFEFTSRW